jgi:hypothetical protein
MQSKLPVKIIAQPGQLPEFWDRPAVFFANLLALFFGNEAETASLAEEVGEIDSYGGRLIPILNLIFRGGNSLLVLEREPDEHLCRYFSQGLGLDLPELKILEHSDYVEMGKALVSGEAQHRLLDEASGHPARWVDGYVTDETLSLIARAIGKQTVSSPEGSQTGNNKYLLHRHLCESVLPVVETGVANNNDEVKGIIAGFWRDGYSQAVVKAQIGASGIGMMKVAAGEEIEVPGYFFFEGPVLVQVWLKPGEKGVTRMRSPSVQMFLDEDSVFLYDITEQVLSEASIHEGNESPPAYLAGHPEIGEELLRQAGMAGAWLHSCGYRGTASTDFLLVDREGREEAEVYVCEINARVTGATYPSVLAHHLRRGGAWLLRNLRLQEPQRGDVLLDLLDQPGHLYMPGMGEGVVPINFNFGEDGKVHKGQFLCLAESVERCHQILDFIEQDLPVRMEKTRD